MFIMTIRSAYEGSRIAQDESRPGEDWEATVARLYQEANPPQPGETSGWWSASVAVVARSVWPEDQAWSVELMKLVGPYQLVVIGPDRSTPKELVLVKTDPPQP